MRLRSESLTGPRGSATGRRDPAHSGARLRPWRVGRRRTTDDRSSDTGPPAAADVPKTWGSSHSGALIPHASRATTAHAQPIMTVEVTITCAEYVRLRTRRSFPVFP